MAAAVLIGASAASAEPAVESLEARLDALCLESFPNQNEPGMAVLVMVDGKPVLRKGYGLSDLSSKAKSTPDTIFRIGSITKQFTAVCVLQLVQSGKVALDDPITKHLPEVETHGKTITVEQLLSHTSGLFNVTARDDFDAQITKDLKPGEVAALVNDKPLEFEPGSRFKYSNTNYIILGMLIEKISGKTYAEYLIENVCKPLDLKDTRYSQTEAFTPRHARGYEKDKATGKWAPAPPLSMTQPHAAGAIESTVDDIAKWMAALDEGKLIDPALRDRAWTPFVPKDRPSNYGFGWGIREESGERWISHGGAINGYMSNMVWIPEKKVFVAVLRNALGETSPEYILRALTLEAVGRPLPKRTSIKVPVATLQKYTGTFAVDPERKLTFSLSNGKLFVETPTKTKLEMFAETENRFFSKEIDMQVEFNVEDKKSTRATLTRNGRDMEMTREK